MLATRGNSSIAPLPAKAVATGADAESSITPKEITDSHKWDQIIDYRLIEWGRDPSLLEDDDVEAPRGEVIHRAIALAQRLKERGLPAPHSVVLDPNGGIVFERRSSDAVETLHVWDDGTIEYCRFQGTRLLERRPL